ncbi:MAG: hypothetical protein CMK36_07900 [Porticoccaceae bacterium]|nr:hypothetical protein [Porticoccaceae bacterium]|tara:strand:- start:1893 stop:12611 length:10719 start_codon:yes stop_codon:yes gene_type:complete
MTEFQDYSDWVKQRPVSSDSTQNKVDYSNYLRKTHLDSDDYSLEVENSIQNELYGSLVSSGDIEEGDVDAFSSLTTPQAISSEAKMDIIQSRIDPKSSSWQAITAYKTAEADGLPPEEVQRLKTNAGFIADREYDSMKRQMVRNGELAFAAFTNLDGSREIIAGDAAIGANLSDALKASKMGEVTLSDALAAQQQMTPAFGTKVPAFKASRYNQASAIMSELIRGDEKTNTLLQAHAELRAGEEDEGFMDQAANVVNAFGDAFVGIFSSDKREQNTAMFRAKDVTRAEAVADIMLRINSSNALPEGEEFTAQEVGAAFDHAVLARATAQNMFDQYTGEEAGRNLRISSTGMPIMASDVLANEDLFNDTVKGSTLDDNQKDFLRQTRTSVLTERFEDYSEMFKRSAVEDQWSQALIEGANQGKKNHEILNDFLKDEDNYDLVTQRSKGIAWSLVNSLGTLAAAIPAAAGNKMATDYLADVAQKNSDRQQIARLFGQEYGYAGEIGETIAPMVTDISATAFLSAGTFGTGGAAYVAAKSGSVAVAKTVTKSYVNHVVKSVPRSVFRIKGAKYQGKLSDAINIAVKKGHSDLTMDVLKEFNSEVVRKAGIASAAAIPAATRSSAATYGAITNALRSDSDMSDEEIRDKALGAGMMSGAITGILTGGFSALGRGGLDDALLRGMTFRDMTKVVSKMTNVTNKTNLDANVKAALRKSIAESAKKAGLASAALTKKASRIRSRAGEIAGAVGRNFGDEAVEEGLDEFFNSFVEDAALDQDTPMFERLSQSYHAAVLGGIMGAGAPAVQKAGAALRRQRGITFSQVDKMASDVAQSASENLKANGSPVAAAVLERLFQTPLREMVAAPEVTTDTPAPDDTPPPADTTVTTDTPPPADTTVPVTEDVTSDEVVEEPTEVEGDPASVDEAFENNPDEAKALSLDEINKREANEEPDKSKPRKKAKNKVGKKKVAKEKVAKKKVAKKIEEEEEIVYDLDEETMADLQAELEEETGQKEAEPTPAEETAARKAVAKKAVAKKAAAKKAAAKKAAAKKAAAKKAAKKTVAKKVVKKSKLKKRIERKEKDPFYIVPDPKQAKNFYNEKDFLSSGVNPEEVTDENGEIVLSTEEREIADKVFALSKKGFPVNFTKQARYGVDLSKHQENDGRDRISTVLAREVYNRFPVLQPTESTAKGLDKFSTGAAKYGAKKVTHYDPVTGKRKTLSVKGYLDMNGNGVFNNDPITMTEMLARDIPVFIPKEFRDSPLLNPSFVNHFDPQSGQLLGLQKPHKEDPNRIELVRKEIRRTEEPYDFSAFLSLANLKFIRPDDKPAYKQIRSWKFLIGEAKGKTPARGNYLEGSFIKKTGDSILIRRKAEDKDTVKINALRKELRVLENTPFKDPEAKAAARRKIQDKLALARSRTITIPISKLSDYDRNWLENVPTDKELSAPDPTLPLGVSLTNPRTGMPIEASNKTRHKMSDVLRSVGDFATLALPLASEAKVTLSDGSTASSRGMRAVTNLLAPASRESFRRLGSAMGFSVENIVTEIEIEYEILLNFFNIRQEILTDQQKLAKKTTHKLSPLQFNKGVDLLLRHMSLDVDESSLRTQKGIISPQKIKKARMQAASDLISRYSGNSGGSPIENVRNFLLKDVVNNERFRKTGRMPDLMGLVRLSADKYVKQSITRGSVEKERDTESLDDLSFEGSIGMSDAQAVVGSLDMLDVDLGSLPDSFASIVDRAILEVNENEELRSELEALYIDSILINSPTSSIDEVPNLDPRDLIAGIADIISMAGYDSPSSKNALAFKRAVEQSEYFTPQSSLRIALESIYYGDGDPVRIGNYLAKLKRRQDRYRPDLSISEYRAYTESYEEGERMALEEERGEPITLTEKGMEIAAEGGATPTRYARRLVREKQEEESVPAIEGLSTVKEQMDIVQGKAVFDALSEQDKNIIKGIQATVLKGDLSLEEKENLRDITSRIISPTTSETELEEIRDEVKRIIGRANNNASQNSASQAATPMERKLMRADNIAEIGRLGLEHDSPDTVIEALKTISTESDNPSHKLVADLLLEDESFLSSVDFHIVDSPANFAGQYVYRTDGTHRVSINIDTGNKLGLENVLLEEYVHAFLSDVTKSNADQRSDQQNEAVERLNRIYKLAEKQYRAKGIKDPMLEDAFVDFDEFLAKFLLSPKLQASIKSLEAPADQRGFFKRIIDSILSMFRKRKVSKTEAVEYGKALQDVIDLAKSPTLAQLPPLTQDAARVAKETSSILSRVQEETIKHEERKENRMTSEGVSLMAVEDTVSDEPVTFESEKSRKIMEVEAYLRSRIPRGLSLQEAALLDIGSIARLDQGNFNSDGIQIVEFDFKAFEVATRGMDMVGAKVYAEKTLLHETIHSASYNVLTVEEITTLEESLSDEDYASIAETYFRTDEAIAEAKAKLDSENVEEAALIRRQLAEEHLRMNSERILSGTTTEEDAEFWSSDPSLLSIIARYVRSMFARLAAIRRAQGGSGVLDAMLISIHNEVTLIQNGYVSYDPSMEFNTDDPEESLNKFNEILRRDIGSGQPEGVALQAQVGASSASDVDFSNIPKLLELSMVEFKTYKSPKTWFARNFKGDVDLPVKRIMEQRAEFERASTRVLKTFHTEFNKIIERDFGEMTQELSDKINLAQGYSPTSLVKEEFYREVEEEHRLTVRQINKDDSLTDVQKKEQKAESRKIKEKKIEELENVKIAEHQQAVDKALDDIRQTSPDLAAKITLMREELIRPIQKIMTEDGSGLSKELRARIDRTGGIYLTRQYKIFNDPTYAQKVLEDPDFQTAREFAIEYFTNQMGLSEADATEAMRVFVQQYDTGLQGSGTPLTKSYKKIMKNLSRRKDLPIALRNLMGEYGLEESTKGEPATNLLLRTFATVSSLAAQQKFRSNIVKWGDESKSIISKADRDADTEKFGDYVLLIDPKTAVKGDPLAGKYAAADTVKDLREVLTASPIGIDSSSAGKTVEGMAKVMQNLTGKSMLFKTLGSVGFYLRNILGNVLFFGPAQGVSLSTMGGTMTDSYNSIKGILNPDQIDAELTEMVGLGVFGDELRAGMIKELLDGKNETFLDKLNNILDKVPDDKASGVKGVTTKTREKVKSLEEALMRLSSNVDGVYKIQYYKHELGVLMEAREKYPDTRIFGKGSKKFKDATDEQLKRTAADKVKRTAQSLSQAPPIISKLSKSSYGMLFAPFIRFKTEVPRIVFNTYELAKEEMASDNPLIKARGKRRRAAMTAMVGGFSLGLPAAAALLMAGIGNDEDEALRKSMPSYLRGHSFFFFRVGGDLQSIDLTYVNPFSIMADPVARSFQELTRGNADGAVGSFLKGFFFDQYLDEQILAGAVQDAMDNRDAKTDRPISIDKVDGFSVAFAKRFAYVMDTAYTPRLLSDAWDAYKAMGTDFEEFSDSPVGEFFSGTLPFRIHDVDEEAQFRRFIRDHKDRVNEVKSKKYRMYSDQPISEDEIRDIYNDEADDLITLNKEMYTVMQGFKGLGIEDREQFNMMKGAGIGKDKSRLLRVGVSDRLTPNVGFLEGLKQRGLADRISPMLEEKNKRARYHRLDD